MIVLAFTILVTILFHVHVIIYVVSCDRLTLTRAKHYHLTEPLHRLFVASKAAVCCAAPVMVPEPAVFRADSVVVITGCSRGLGLEYVKQILETTESHVVATARNPQKSDALTGLSKQYVKRLKLVTLDTEDESSIKAAVQEVDSAYSGVDLLINNAGVCESVEEPALEITASWYEKVLRVNVIGTYLVTRTFLPLLLKRNTRTVVQISSGLGSISGNRLAMTEPEKNPIGNRFIAYNASKAAINMQTSVFANELKKDNFCLVSMDPGWVDTDMGGGNARRLGMEKAPTDAHHSISSMLKTIKQLSVKDSGEFVGIDGKKMDY